MFYFGIWKIFIAAAATILQEPHFWRTKGQELFAFLFWLVACEPLQHMI